MTHDGSEGLSPDGWLPDRIWVGVLARVFTPELDAAVDEAGARELRRWLLTARLVVYFTLALWLFRGGDVRTQTFRSETVRNHI